MTHKNLDIECPCCRTRLAVDVASGKVLRWSGAAARDAASSGDADAFERLAERVKSRESGGASELDAALQKERERARQLDELFERRKREAGDP